MSLPHFTKGGNFYHFLLASKADIALLKQVYSSRKEFAPSEGKSPFTGMEDRKDNGRAAFAESVPIHLYRIKFYKTFICAT